MADDGKGSWGGKREGAGSGGVREGAGRPKNAHDVVLSPSRIVSVGQKWKFAEKFLQYAEEMLDRMVDLARNAQSEAVRLAAQNSIIDRALGKAPQHIDVSAVHHTEIVYRSAEQIRQELLERGVPQVLLDYTPPKSDDDEEDPPSDGEDSKS
jgi:hypothetical protein